MDGRTEAGAVMREHHPRRWVLGSMVAAACMLATALPVPAQRPVRIVEIEQPEHLGGRRTGSGRAVPHPAAGVAQPLCLGQRGLASLKREPRSGREGRGHPTRPFQAGTLPAVNVSRV
jgi:hypothetical protein